MSKKNKILIGTLSVLLVCALVAGFSYAYWRLTYTQTTSNKIATSCFSMELANEKNDITLESAYPISDEKGKELTPYSFTITNTCDLFASYTINLEMLSGTTLNSKYIKTMINNEAIANLSTLETTDPSIEGATESRILFKGSLGSGDSTDYTFRLWMDSATEATDDSMNKILQAKISVVGEAKAYSPVENGFTLLNEALLVNEYQTTSLDVAKNNIAIKQAVDTTKTAPIIEWESKTVNSSKIYKAMKAPPSMIGSYGVVENATKIKFGTNYVFNKNTGYYTPTSTAYYDPTTLDFSNNNYYFCGSNVAITANDTISYWDGESCSSLYKVNSLDSTSEQDGILSTGNKITFINYHLNTTELSSVELESDKSDKGLYESVDDYGPTYYYRGNVTNNYVKFAGYYWQVIRINGDGSVRLLYNGENVNDFDINIEGNHFNYPSNNPTYSGYMYSNNLNSSYNETISNDNESNIKKKLDIWYKDNILDKGYSMFIADSGFCNDRSISPVSPGDGSNASVETHFSPKYRVINKKPIFTCPNQSNDLFTLSDNTLGNKKLTYPIGLITADELVFAGSLYNVLNRYTYTYTKTSYWTMSPDVYLTSAATVTIWYQIGNGSLGGAGVGSKTPMPRPVINLKADTEISGGIGTANDPFIIK